VEPEEQDPSLLSGWHVVEAGRRQAWLFVNLADPASGREVRLFIDATFSIDPGWSNVKQHDAAALPALDALSGLTVTSVESAGASLVLNLDTVVFQIQGVGNELTSHAPWWVGAR
jgi:hypothetical protein